MSKKIVLLACKGDSTNYLYNFLEKDISIEKVIIEDTISRKILLKNRVKRIGLLKVMGQVLFMLFVPKLLSLTSKKRLAEIEKDYGLNSKDIPKSKIQRVNSVNSKETIELLREIQPDIVLVNGTRIIKKNIITSINAKFINVHAGITPKYRGVHGGYWALYNNDSTNCGVTVHFVDEGIDTGQVIAQALIQPTNKDNYTTYPLLQLGEGLKVLKTVLIDYDNLKTTNAMTSESKLWYHPTFVQYIGKRIGKNIK